MAHFLIQSPHTKEECLRALDELVAKDPKLLERFEFGCMAGDHTGYAVMDVPGERQAREFVPGFLRDKARVVPVSKFTPEQVRGYHEK